MIRKKAPEPENHERWLVSYADFITLLFAFFVVMFATAQSDKSKAKDLSSSVREAFEHGQLSSAVSNVLHGKPDIQKLANQPLTNNTPEAQTAAALAAPPTPAPADLSKSLGTLKDGLAPDLKSGKVQLKLEGRGLVISLREAAFFASGDSGVAPGSLPILAKIAAVIQPLTNSVRLEGYTDSVPIHNSRFRNNWELSSARSIAMLEVLRDRFQVPSARMAVAGYAENAPADSNDTEEGRAHNRRVELVVLSAEGQNSEPKATVR
jgi:chemotaxis protein MotB